MPASLGLYPSAARAIATTRAKEALHLPELERTVVPGVQAGEDYSILVHPNGDKTYLIQLVLDGHGFHGDLFALHGGEFLSLRVEHYWG